MQNYNSACPLLSYPSLLPFELNLLPTFTPKNNWKEAFHSNILSWGTPPLQSQGKTQGWESYVSVFGNIVYSPNSFV